MGDPKFPTICISLVHESIAPGELLDRWQSRLRSCLGEAPAATSLFIGRVRGTTAAGLALEALELEHYPGMTERQLEQLACSCAERHGAKAVLVVHRVGRIRPGEAIVVVAVMTDRRGPAQRCCQDLLEALKHEAPFWKREWAGDAGRWVGGNTPLEECPQL
ncbi:MAG: molybdenum cofactor biosynthesis protein MoaE [Cyanobacteriota bacterium]|jgi:molybdopterin synthase catalytic subunit